MPTKFNTATEGRRVDLDPVIPVMGEAPDTSESEYRAAGDMLASITESLDALKKDADLVALDSYAVQAGDIVSQTQGYASERERIMQGITTAQDKETVLRYYTELSRLRNGEIQGALSPIRASALINNLTKNTINRNPGLALKIRQLHNGILSDIPAVSGFSGKEVDPDLEAMQELIKKSVTTGRSVPELIAIENQEITAKQQDAILRTKVSLGTASVADISSSIQNHLATFYGKLAGAMGAAQNDPNFQGANWVWELQSAEATITQTVNAAIAKAQLEGKMIISKDEREAILKDALAPLKAFQTAADKIDNPKTRASAALAMRQIAESGDFMNIRKRIGPMATLMGNDLMSFLDDFSKVVRQIKDGNRAELEALANAGDVKTQLILSAIDGKSFDQWIATAIADAANDKEFKDSGVPLLDRMKLQAIFDYALNVRTPTEKTEIALAHAMGHPDAFDALEKRSDVMRRVQMYPEAIRRLRNNGTKLLLAAADEARLSDLQSIRFVPKSESTRGKGTAFSRKEPIFLQMDVGNLRGSGSPWGSGVTSLRSLDAAQLVSKMNQQYRVFSNLVGVEGGFGSKQELDQWFATTLFDLQNSQDPDFIETARPKKEEKKPTPKSSSPKFGRFSVNPKTGVIADSKTGMDLSPVAMETLESKLNEEEIRDLNRAIEWSYTNYAPDIDIPISPNPLEDAE